MKRTTKIFSLTLFIMLFVSAIALFFVNAPTIKNTVEPTIEEFLTFEQEIIDLNKEFFDSQNNSGATGLDSEIDYSELGEFALKRLIVTGDVKNTYGAIKDISYGDMHILCYLTEDLTEAAYNKLVLDSSLTVMIDDIVEVEEYAETDYDYSSFRHR